MENIESFTQDYLERARRRKQMLDQKLAEASPRRKRTNPLSELQDVTKEPTIDDDSPNKRQCVREDEGLVHPDTPAVPGVRSRLKQLSAQRQAWDGPDGAVDTAAPTASQDLSPLQEKPKQRRTRLADLAQNINNWEDDLSHHAFKKEERSKRVWQPPKPIEVPDAARDGPSKPPRTFTHDVTGAALRCTAQDGDSEEGSVGSATPPVRSPLQEASRVSEQVVHADGKSVSTLTITLGTGGSGKETIAVTPTRAARGVSPVKAAATTPKGVFSPVKAVSASPMKVGSPRKAPESPAGRRGVVGTPAGRPGAVATPAGQGRGRAAAAAGEDEPSATPVSARLAGWQTRVNQVEQTKQGATGATVGAGPRGQRLPSAATPAATPRGHLSPTKAATPEPTNQSVQSRKALWQQRTDQEDQPPATPSAAATPLRPTAGRTPMKTPGFVASAAKLGPSGPTAAPGSSRSPVKSPVQAVSPVKVAPGTRGIHDKLQALQQNWTSNEIAEKIRREREAEMAQLNNRWQNGVLREDSKQETSSAPAAPSSHTVNAPSPVKTPSKAPAAKTPVAKTPVAKTPQDRKEDSRNKMRAACQAKLQEAMGESAGKGSPSTDTEHAHFENRLMAVGFEIQSVSELGHVATLDLKEQRAKDKERQALEERRKQGQGRSPMKVNVTEQKVTSIKFDDKSRVTSSVQPAASAPKRPEVETVSYVSSVTSSVGVRPAAVVSASPAPSAGGSLYSLIKKQNPATTPSMLHRASPAPASATRRLNDSFSSDETSFEEDEPRASQAPPTPAQAVRGSPRKQLYMSPPVAASSSSIQSETYSEYSESQTEPNTSQESESEYDSEESYDETVDETVDETADDSELNDLLDEVLSEEEEEEEESMRSMPVPAPRRTRPAEAARPAPQAHQTVYEAPADRPVQMRRRAEEPPQEQRRVQFAENEASHSAYTIDMYRSSANKKKNAPAPKMTIVRRSQLIMESETEEEHTHVQPENAKHKLQELQDMVNQELNVITQTSNALNQCCGSTSAFAGSTEAVECHRILLTACKKREAYMAEMQRLRNGQKARAGPVGSLTISDIRLPLKHSFTTQIGSLSDTTVHYFLLLFRYGAHVVFTQMVSTHDAMVRGSLEMPNLIKFSDIRGDFCVDMEIYSMSVTREINQPQTPKKKKGLTPKKASSARKGFGHHMQSPGGPLAVRTTNFTLIASLPITGRFLERSNFTLEHVPFSSPLQGAVHMRLRCLMETNVIQKGFLTMFEDVSGMGAWHRRWAVVKSHKLSCWKYPDDEKSKEPIVMIDLKSCITDEVRLVARDVCARPNTFELRSVRRQQRGERDTIVTKCSNTMTTTKHWLAADTKEDRVAWCRALNEALHNVRTWHTDALRPVKQSLPGHETGI